VDTMTEYKKRDFGYTDPADTHGIVEQQFIADKSKDGIDWVTAVSPFILRNIADLIDFCYPHAAYVDVGLTEPPSDGSDAKDLVFGKARDERLIMAASRTDGYVDESPVKKDYLA